MKRTIICILTLVVAMALVVHHAEAQKKEVTTLSLIAVVDALNPVRGAIDMWKKKVEEATNGQVNIEIRGGPETFPVLEQVEAVRNGIVDVNATFSAYYLSLVQEVTGFQLSQLEPWDERKSGFLDFMDEAHNRVGLKYLVRWQIHMPVYIWLKNPVNSVADFKGMRLRTMAMYDRFFRELGAVPVTMPHSDIYTALQRGLVVGMGYPFLGGLAAGYPEVTKYIVDHPYFNASNSVIIANLASWKKIPADLQKKITEATAQYEHDVAKFYDELLVQERKKLTEAGMKFIKFPPDEAKRYRQMAYDVEWKALSEKLPAATIEKIKKLSGN